MNTYYQTKLNDVIEDCKIILKLIAAGRLQQAQQDAIAVSHILCNIHGGDQKTRELMDIATSRFSEVHKALLKAA